MLNEPILWRTLYAKVETAGMEPQDGEDCYKVVLTPEGEKPETMYFSKKSGLLIKTGRNGRQPDGRDPGGRLGVGLQKLRRRVQPTGCRRKTTGRNS